MNKRIPKILAMAIVLMMIVSLTLIVPSMAAVSAPKAVTNLKAASASYSSIKLTWSSVSGAAGYGIYRSTSSTGTYTGVGISKTAAFTNTGLTTGKYYYYKVRAYVMSGTARIYGAFSNVAYAKPLTSAPASPKAVSASSTSINITWSAVSGASGYAVYRAATSAGPYIAVSAPSTTNYTNSGLKTGTAYYYKVRAYRLVSGVRVYGYYSAVATAKPTASTVAANYKGVVFIPSFASIQLDAECFSLNLGTREQANVKNGAASMHYPYVWQENYPIEATTPLKKADFDADMKVAPRYFRVNLTKSQKIGTAAEKNFRDAIARGDAPGFIWAQYPIPTDSKSLPTDTKKVYIRTFIDDYKYSTRYPKTDYKNQAQIYVNKLVGDFDRVHAARPNAKIYVGSMELTTYSFPRIDNPALMTDSMFTKWGALIGGLKSGITWTRDYKVRAEINRLVADYCKTKGYIFIDLTKAGMTDSNGYLLEKYSHVNGIGYQMNQAGLTMEGDYICKAMGLPTAKQAYNLK